MWVLTSSHHSGLLLSSQKLSSCHYLLSLLCCQFLHLHSHLPIKEMLFLSFSYLKHAYTHTHTPKTSLLSHFSSYYVIYLLHFTIKCSNILFYFFISLLSLTHLARLPVTYILQSHLCRQGMQSHGRYSLSTSLVSDTVGWPHPPSQITFLPRQSSRLTWSFSCLTVCYFSASHLVSLPFLDL